MIHPLLILLDDWLKLRQQQEALKLRWHWNWMIGSSQMVALGAVRSLNGSWYLETKLAVSTEARWRFEVECGPRLPQLKSDQEFCGFADDLNLWGVPIAQFAAVDIAQVPLRAAHLNSLRLTAVLG
jgi:hypothetical protein